MLGVNKRTNATLFLLFRNNVQCQRRLPRRFRSVNFNYAAFGQATNTKRDIQTDRPGRRRINRWHLVLTTKLHNRALAKLTLDLRQCAFKRLFFIRCLFVCHFQELCRCHYLCPYSTHREGRQLLLCSTYVPVNQ